MTQPPLSPNWPRPTTSAAVRPANGAIATIITSFDVWAAELPRIEIYGTLGSLSVPDPNGFGGPVRIRRAGASEWSTVPLTHGYQENSRGIGVADQVDRVVRVEREERDADAAGQVDLVVVQVEHAAHVVEDLARDAAERVPMILARGEVLDEHRELVAGEPADHGVGDDRDSSLSVHAAHRDTGRRAFPCLSMCSFNLDHDKLHLLAHYRYEYLVTKGYGNYLGLARLLQYVADQTGLGVGQMTIVSGRTHVDAPKRDIWQHLGHHPATARSSSG